jgi:hypothetical protein
VTLAPTPEPTDDFRSIAGVVLESGGALPQQLGRSER